MNLLGTTWGRRGLFAALYFSEGAPIGYIWWALPTILRDAGVEIDRVTALTSMLVLPWMFKFVWAPLVDTLRGPRWNYRAWIITTQIGMGLALLPLIGVSLTENIGIVAAALLLHTLLAATQDVSIDALCIASTRPDERGAINGWMQVGMLTSRAVFGGVALAAERWIGTDGVILALIACIWSTTLLVAFATSDRGVGLAEREAGAGNHRWRQFGRTLVTTLLSRTTLLALLFAALAGAGFEAVGAVAGAMLVDFGVSKEAVGAFYAVPVVVCMAGGALVGGWLSDRVGRRRGVLAAGVLMAVTIVVLAGLLARVPEATFVLRGVLAAIYLLIGVFTATTYALFMDLTNPALGGTQFSAFMGATNLCESWSALVVGVLIVSYGYPLALAVMAVIALPGLALLPMLRTVDSVPRSSPPSS